MLTIDPERLALAPGLRVLDAGCGRGRHAHAVSLSGALSVGVDLAEPDLRAARNDWRAIAPQSPVHVAAADAARLPFPDAAFDRVICSEVLEHVPDWRAVLAELDRVLAPGGLMALSVPSRWPEALCWRLSPEYAATPGGHVRIFRGRTLAGAVRARGLKLLKTARAHALHSPYWWLQCAFWETRESNALIDTYRRFLEWDITKSPRPVRALEAALNPVLGKSLVLYAAKPEAA